MEGYERNDEGAALMQDTASRAVAMAKDIIIGEAEKAFPDEDNPVHAARQIGSIITASTMLYVAMLETVAKMENKKEAALALGLASVLITGPLSDVSTVAKEGK